MSRLAATPDARGLRPGKAVPVLAGALLVFAVPFAPAQTQRWDFDLETSGENVYYTSPTAVDNSAPEYDARYEITLVEVWVSYIGIVFGPFDITDEIPAEQRTGSGTWPGPPPFVVADEHVRYPAEPEPVAFEADVLIEVDAAGYGHASITDVTLGTVLFNLGWPWGWVEVQLETVRAVGTVWVTPIFRGDVDRDGDVDLSDLSALLAAYGACTGDPAYDADADFDDSGCVDLSDLAALLAGYGRGA